MKLQRDLVKAYKLISFKTQIFARFESFNDFAKYSWQLMVIFYLAQEWDPKIKSFWFEGERHEELCKRKKGQHLNVDQRAYICNLLKEFPENHNSIKVEYRLSSTTFSRLYRFKYLTIHEPKEGNMNKLRKTSIRTDAQNFIAEIVSPPQFPMTIKKIRKAVFKKIRKDV